MIRHPFPSLVAAVARRIPAARRPLVRAVFCAVFCALLYAWPCAAQAKDISAREAAAAESANACMGESERTLIEGSFFMGEFSLFRLGKRHKIMPVKNAPR